MHHKCDRPMQDTCADILVITRSSVPNLRKIKLSSLWDNSVHLGGWGSRPPHMDKVQRGLRVSRFSKKMLKDILQILHSLEELALERTGPFTTEIDLATNSVIKLNIFRGHTQTSSLRYLKLSHLQIVEKRWLVFFVQFLLHRSISKSITLPFIADYGHLGDHRHLSTRNQRQATQIAVVHSRKLWAI